MPRPAAQHPHPAVKAAETPPERFGAVVAGGPIAELQRCLEARLLTADHTEIARPVEADAAHRLSRLCGPALLVAAYAGVALWWS